MRIPFTVFAAATLLTLSAVGPAHAADQPTDVRLKFGWSDLPKNSARGVVQHGRFTLVNEGRNTIDGVILQFRTTRGMELTQRFSNCEYSTTPEDVLKVQPYHGKVLCFVPGTYEPGAAYDVVPKVDVVGRDVAYRDWLQTGAYADTPATRAQLRGRSSQIKGTGPELKLEKLPQGQHAPNLDSDDEFLYPNTADLSVKGTQVEGAAGASVRAAVEFRNLGPAWVSELWRFHNIAYVDIAFPQGVKVLKAPKGCHVADPDTTAQDAPKLEPGVDYRCPTGSFVLENQKTTYPFELRLGPRAGTAKGAVYVGSPYMSYDTKPQNNRADIVVKTTGPGSTTGGSGGTTSGTNTSGTSGTSGSSSTGTAGAGGSTATGGTSTGGSTTSGSAQGGSLASTGSSAALAGAGALALLAAGAGVLRSVRRR